MDNSGVLYETIRAYYVLRDGKNALDAKIRAAENGKWAQYFERFIQQCRNFEVNPTWVLKVMMSRMPNTHKGGELYPNQLCSDYAWKRFYRNYQALERCINFNTKGAAIPHTSVPKKDIIMAQIRHSVNALKQFRDLYAQFETAELYTNFAGVLSAYHMAASKVVKRLYKAKMLPVSVAVRVRKAYRELVSHDILTFAQELVKE